MQLEREGGRELGAEPAMSASVTDTQGLRSSQTKAQIMIAGSGGDLGGDYGGGQPLPCAHPSATLQLLFPHSGGESTGS